MKLEDQAGVSLVKSGELGEVTFFRYSLTINRQHQDKETAVLDEVFSWIRAAGISELQSVSASYAKGKKVLLVTMSFSDNVFANIFINMESQETGYVKGIEIAGTKSLYVYNSAGETAFTSDCIPQKEYQFTQNSNEENSTWLGLVAASLESQEVEAIS